MSHLVRPLGGVVFLAAVGFVTLRNLPPVRPADTVGDWVVVGLFALGVAAAVVARDTLAAVAALGFVGLLMAALFVTAGARSDERRVGKECVSTCRFGWCTVS